jgi:hypothetical protein
MTSRLSHLLSVLKASHIAAIEAKAENMMKIQDR